MGDRSFPVHVSERRSIGSDLDAERSSVAKNCRPRKRQPAHPGWKHVGITDQKTVGRVEPAPCLQVRGTELLDRGIVVRLPVFEKSVPVSRALLNV